jgi:hypothetical protein
MYAGVPVVARVAVKPLTASPSRVTGLTRPKSSTFRKSTVSPCRQVNRLAGLMSRWMRPCSCASASESHACISRCAARAGSTGPKRFTSVSRSSPVRSSIA